MRNTIRTVSGDKLGDTTLLSAQHAIMDETQRPNTPAKPMGHEVVNQVSFILFDTQFVEEV
jgi:hypothetical protein